MIFSFSAVRTGLIICVLLISGCQHRVPYPEQSQVPVPRHHDLSLQRKMQALEHWKILAEDIAANVREEIENSRHAGKPVYVAAAGTTDFEKNFRELLISALVAKNIDIRTTNHRGGHGLLDFKLATVAHNKRMIVTDKGIYRALSPDVVAKRERPYPYGYSHPQCYPDCYVPYRYPMVNVEAGGHTIELPRHEVLITTSLVYDDTYAFRNSAVYYINDEDLGQYENNPHSKPSAARQYYMTNDR